jgi:hypothetical protein
VRVLVRDAVALDEAAADRRRRLERHLLRRDRGDERLERIRLQGRPESRERGDEPGERLVRGHPPRQAVEIERGAEKVEHFRFDRRIVRTDVDASRGGLDPYFPIAEDTMDPAVAPERRPVEAVDLEPRRREPEVVRLRQADEHGSMLSSGRGPLPIEPACAASPPSGCPR